MKKSHLPWILLILPTVIALPHNSNETTESIENGFLPLVEPKLESLETLLKAFKIQDFEGLASCRSENAFCPFEKQELLNFTRKINKNYIPFNSTGNKKDFATAFSAQVMPLNSAEPDFETVKSNLRNNIASASMIYLLFWAYGSSLKKHEIQQFHELYKTANETFMNDLQTLHDDSRKQLTESLYERTLLNARFDLIVKDIELNLTKEERQVNLIVTEIERENYVMAMTLFLELDDAESLFEITERIMDNEKLLRFFGTLPTYLNRLLGYSAMLKKTNLGYTIFTIDHDSHDMREFIFTQETPEERSKKPRRRYDDFSIHRFDRLLRDKVDETVKLITQLILERKDPESYAKLIEYSSSQVEPFNAHLVILVRNLFDFGIRDDDDDDDDDDNIQNLHHYLRHGNNEKIRAVMDNKDKLKAVLAFAGDLTEITQSARVYLEFSRLIQMPAGEEIDFQFSLQIASKVKELTLMKNYLTTPQEVKKELEEFKEKLEPIVKRIIWGHVCIKNVETGGYLHKNDRCDSDRGNVILTENRDLWAIESSGKNNSFKIRHVETNELLYSTNGRLIFTGFEDERIVSNQYWNLGKFGVEHESEESFYMKNVGLNEFMSNVKKQDVFVICTDAITTEDSQLERLFSENQKPGPYESRDFNKAWIFFDSARC